MCYYGNMNDKVIKVYKKVGETPLECIDNLKKGAAGQAVQNMNIIAGFDETEGLL